MVNKKTRIAGYAAGLLPRHVGIILDGNRRHARANGMHDPEVIYRIGAAKLDDILSWSADLGIPAVTLWVFSPDNLGRPGAEINGILGAVEAKMRALVADPPRSSAAGQSLVAGAVHVTSRGLTTSPIPYGSRIFQIDFDFIDHRLVIQTSEGAREWLPLQPRTVAEFYKTLMDRLSTLGLDIRIWTMPVELPDTVRFEEDREHGAYDPDYAHRFWRTLVQADRIFTEFRARFVGKVSPVHFFWGSFDLAVTRFSGRPATLHPGAPNVTDHVTREAYCDEVSSCGFWPGGAGMEEPVFYSYANPTPSGFIDAPVRPKSASYSRDMGEFILPYDHVRQADAPDVMLLDFLQSTYEVAADFGHWQRVSLERVVSR